MVLNTIRLGRSVNTGKIEGLLGYWGKVVSFATMNTRYVQFAEAGLAS